MSLLVLVSEGIMFTPPFFSEQIVQKILQLVG
jgi:hypothetical protein